MPVTGCPHPALGGPANHPQSCLDSAVARGAVSCDAPPAARGEPADAPRI